MPARCAGALSSTSTDRESRAIKPHHHAVAHSSETTSGRQRLFTRYAIAILVDLVVLNLFAEYSSRVTIDTFTTSLLAAILLQLLLQATLSVEHWVAERFAGRSGPLWKTLRLLSGWTVLFGSKFIILWAVERSFGDGLLFGGPMHGVGTLITVLVAMLGAEALFVWTFKRLK